MITRGRGAGTQQRPKTKVQQLGTLLPSVPRPLLVPPHYSPGCGTDPTGGANKKDASDAFKRWWAALPANEVTVFSDGSEQHDTSGRIVGYGYVIYQGSREIGKGCGSINPLSHVFDAEAIGAWLGLRQAVTLPPTVSQQRIWMCIDSTSVIWCARGNAPTSSQWAFLNCQRVMASHNVAYKWCPGHPGIQGNEVADRLANEGARKPEWDPEAAQPTVSGIRSVSRQLREQACDEWWATHKARLSSWYKRWELPYATKQPPELSLSRPLCIDS